MPSTQRSTTILVVDDNPDARMMMDDFLNGRNYRVILARNGEEALRLFDEEEGGTDLVLLDLMLPDIDGVEVCRRLRQREAGRSTPVIMVTALDDTPSMVDGLEGGADDYVTKPINFQELDARIRAMLRIRTRHLELLEQSGSAMTRTEEVTLLLSQASKLASIGAMVSEVMHEINNPLNGILNYAGILADGEIEADHEVKELLGVIRAEAERIRQLVESLLLFRRAEVHMKSLDLAEVLDSVRTICKYPLKKGGIEIIGRYEHGACFVMGESNKLIQVFLNLIHNAIHALDEKFGNKLGKQITIEMRASERPPGTVVRIRDNGSGIPPASLPHVLEADFTTKEPGAGTGLGLSIVESIVKEHQGTIQVSSSYGDFTEFEVWFPPEDAFIVSEPVPGASEDGSDPHSEEPEGLDASRHVD